MIPARLRRFLGGVKRRARRPLLSVVMPCRDAEAFLEQAIRSVLNQEMRELELIVVDDGSVDGSRAVVERLRQRDRRLRTASTSGGVGPGAARNLGVELARGKFLAFADADDLVLPGAYSAMVASLRGSGSDMVVGGYLRHGAVGSHRPRLVARVHRHDLSATNAGRSPDVLDEPVIWNRMFRAGFWRRSAAPFPETGNYEDREPALRATLRARKFDVLARDVYSWRLSEGRTSRSQHKHEAGDLRDRLAVIERKVPLLAAAEQPIRDRVWARWIGTDLPLFAAHVPGASEDYWTLLHEGVARLASQASRAAWALTPVQDRLLTHVVAAGSRADAEELLGTRAEDTTAVPVVRDDDGTLRADLEVVGRLETDVPAHLLTIDAALLDLECGVRRVTWIGPDVLRVTGWAYVPGLDPGTPGSRLRVTSRDQDGLDSECDVRPLEDEAIDIVSGDPWRTYARAGFAAVVRVVDGVPPQIAVSLELDSYRWSADLPVRLPARPGKALAGVRSDGTDFVTTRVTVDGVELRGPYLSLVGTVTPAPEKLRIGIVTSRRAFESSTVPDPDGRFRAVVIPPGAAFPSDGYFVRWAVDDDGPLVGWARPGEELTQGPAEVDGELQRGSVAMHSESAVSVTVSPPLTAWERSRVGQRQLRSLPRTGGLEPAVLFETFNGKSCGDNPGAVFADLRAAGIDVPMFWSVKDLSIEVPQGAEPLIVGSAAWHHVLAHARVLVNNNNFPHHFSKRAGQFYLQTWHGTPIKRLLWDVPPTSAPLTYRRLMRRQVPMWDLLLAQSAAAERDLRSGLGYEGEVLVVEQPRNAVLYERTGERERVRARLGIDPTENVVLYAPTWREEHRARNRAGTWDEALDVVRFAAAVDARVLVRSHHVSGRTPAVGPRVTDVSHHPSVEELMLAADVLVSDYSSILHDWAITGKPSVVYAPDLAWYRDVERGFYGEWPASSPWPLTEDVDALNRAVREALARATDDLPTIDAQAAREGRRQLVDLIVDRLGGAVTDAVEGTDEEKR